MIVQKRTLNFYRLKKEKKDKNFLHKPVYPGGPSTMMAFIKENLQYPLEAKVLKLEGTVHVRFSIDHEGNVPEAEIISSPIGGGCEEEAIRVVKLLKFDVPKNRGLKVLFHKKLDIHFKMDTHPNPAIKYQYTLKPSQPAGESVKYLYKVDLN